MKMINYPLPIDIFNPGFLYLPQEAKIDNTYSHAGG